MIGRAVGFCSQPLADTGARGLEAFGRSLRGVGRRLVLRGPALSKHVAQ